MDTELLERAVLGSGHVAARVAPGVASVQGYDAGPTPEADTNADVLARFQFQLHCVQELLFCF